MPRLLDEVKQCSLRLGYCFLLVARAGLLSESVNGRRPVQFGVFRSSWKRNHPRRGLEESQ